MTVSFLTPAALVCGLLLAIPVVVHLFKPRRIRQTPFSSLRWLQLSPQKLSRRIQWHQVLLFVLRLAFLALLVLALARPLLAPVGEGKPVDRFVVVDVSRSMTYRAGPDQPSPVERARQLAADLVRSQQPGDRTALLLTGTQTRILCPLSHDAATHLPQVEKVEAGLTDTDLSSALTVIRPQLGQGGGDRDVEICFLTDNHQQSWRQAEIARFLNDLAPGVRVRLIDVGVAAATNGWIGKARLLETGTPPRRTIRVEAACVGEQMQQRVMRLTGLNGLPDKTHDVTLVAGKTTVVDFELPPQFDLRGQVAKLQLDPGDGLPSDDTYWLNLDAQSALRVLVVEGPTTAIEALQPAFPLRAALEVLKEDGKEALVLTRKTSAEVQPADFDHADVVFLADVPELEDAGLTALEGRVRGGAGLVLYVGPASKPSFVNEKLHRTLQPAEGLLPAPVQGKPARPEGGRDPQAALTNIAWTHPLLSGLSDPIIGDFARTHYRSFHRFAALPASAVVLARIDEETPALIEWAVGAGKVLVVNGGPNEGWCDPSQCQDLVPLLDRTLTFLSRGGSRRTFTVGEVVTLPLSAWQPGQPVSVVAPSEARLTPEVRGLGNGRALLRLDAVSEAGVYRVEPSGGAAGFVFVVEPGYQDSVLLPMDVSALEKWWEPAALEVIQGDELGRRLKAGGGRVGLWPLLLLLAGGVLLAEMFLVHWLCPKANPALAQRLVGRRT
jgi:hypothetical protein